MADNIQAFADYNSYVANTTAVTDINVDHGMTRSEVPTILITGTTSYNGIYEAHPITAVIDTFEDNGGGDVLLSASAHGLPAGGGFVTVDGTDAYDDDYAFVWNDANSIIITATYTAETSGATKTIMDRVNFYISAAFCADDGCGRYDRAGWIASWPISGSDPASSTPITSVMSGSPWQHLANWEILEDWWETEHGGITSATSGNHTIGRVGALMVTGASQAALTSPGTGAMTERTDTGEFQIYRWDSTNSSAGWEGITDQKFSRVRDGTGSQTIAASTWTNASQAYTMTGDYDGLSEWASNKFTAAGPGYYMVEAYAEWPDTTSEYNKAIAVWKGSSGASADPYSVKRVYGSSVYSMHLVDTVTMTAGEYLSLYVWHDHSAAVDITKTEIHVSRVS